MTSSLSNEEIHKIICKYGHSNKKCETCRIKCKYCDYFLEYKNFKDDLMDYKCSGFTKNY